MKKSELRKTIQTHLYAEFGKSVENATNHEFWTALSRAVMGQLAPDWEQTRHLYNQGRQAHYFSAEFLVGRSLLNNIVNLGLYDDVQEIVKEAGFDMTDLEEEETDPGLGNGGLGRLAACFLDSCATLDLPVTGYGILYRYGLFRQEIEDGFQKEYPDVWMELPYPFNVRQSSDKVTVHFNDMDIYAVPYDLPVTGFGTENVNALRLWKPEPAQEFDFNLFNSQRFDDAVILRNRVNDINRVLYPNDTSYDGKVLRVRQQYFFVSASLQNILKRFIAVHGKDFKKFPDYNSIQLNDTHPVLAIPELMRLLIDDHQVSWDDAWEITQKTFAYTNHTIMAEALEKWDITIFQFLFPRIMEIIRSIDNKFRDVAQKKGLPFNRIEYLAPIHDGKVHMAWLACFTSYSINGVAAIHSNILKNETLKDFYKMWPERFSNKTNGVTPRRWLRTCNPELSNLLTELAGSEAWVTDLDELKKLEHYRNDQAVMTKLDKIKHKNKIALAKYIERAEGIKVDPYAIFDVQVKRLHEYKRQLLNAFVILDQYYTLKDMPNMDVTPVVYLFGAKSAPGYFRAKAIIKFINEIARLVNNDPDVNDKMKVVFLHNYNVSLAEKIFPAADISEQISTVGMEASGTGNMKFMMNGALTFGTYDGANLEICDAVGEENSFMFGTKLADFPATKAYYNSTWQYNNIVGLKCVVDSLINGTFNDRNTGMFQDLHKSLLHGTSWQPGDPFYVLGDFQDCRARRQDAHKKYKDRGAWLQMCWTNICRSGRFSSDRTIRQYAEEIWNVKPVPWTSKQCNDQKK